MHTINANTNIRCLAYQAPDITQTVVVARKLCINSWNDGTIDGGGNNDGFVDIYDGEL